MHIIIVTGLSGSGKSTAIHVLEDIGFYCIDNLPVALIPRFLELSENNKENISRIALGIDLRERMFLHEYPAVVDGLRERGHHIEILYFEAAEDVLIRRFSETRRPHPAAGDHGILHGIKEEESELSGLKATADLVVNTSSFSVTELRNVLHQRAESYVNDQRTLLVTVESFGYKYGVPLDADIMLDVRFLPNPYLVDHLREDTGLEPTVAAFVLSQKETTTFLGHLWTLLDSCLPLYAREGKSYLTVAIGCTGGQHRSVALAEELGAKLKGHDYTVRIHHRDIQRKGALA